MKTKTYNFETGWQTFLKVTDIGLGNLAGGNYVQKVSDAINKLQKDINEMAASHGNMDPDKLKGFIAEVWHGDTFNIDAAVKGNKAHAVVLESTGFASVDIKADGNNYSLKYYKTGKDSAYAQAISYWQRYNEDMAKRLKSGRPKISFTEYLKQKNVNEEDINKYTSIYNGQFRLIPSDQLKEAIAALERKIAKEAMTRPDLVAGYQETLDKLIDKIKANDGTESIPLTKDEAELFAKLAKDGDFDPANFDISTEKLITFDYIVEQSIQAGVTSAVITCILKIAPEIYKAIDMLIKEGEISKEQFKIIGFKALNGGATGFIRGFISAAITATCKAGKLGVTLKNIDPTVIGTVTAIVMNTIESSYKYAIHQITKYEFAHEVAKDIFVSTCAIGIGSVAQTLTPELPVLGYLLGSFIGSLGGSLLYDTGYSAFMSLCCDTGFTCFGLVDQNYKIPKEILNQLGIKTFDFNSFVPKNVKYKTIDYKKINIKKIEYKTINIQVLHRTVIGIGKIGYSI